MGEWVEMSDVDVRGVKCQISCKTLSDVGLEVRFEDFLMHFRAFLGSSRILSWAEVLAECGAIDEFWLKKSDF